jgi:carboxyl-terminal processing protease
MSSASPSSKQSAAREPLSPGHFYLRMTSLFALVLLVGTGAGIWIGRSTASSGSSQGDDFAALDAVIDVLDGSYYYRPTDPDDMPAYNESLQEHAISGMLASLDDDYTRYLAPEDAQISEDTLAGEYGGIGVTLKVIGDTVLVDRVGPDTPAARAGIKSGDIVQRIDNRPVASVDYPLDGLDLRGPVDSTVVLTVLQEGAEGTINLSIVREAIIVHPVSYQMIGSTTYLWVRIDIFGDRTTQELDEAIAWGATQGATGIVLDLRGNGGGWVKSAQETIGRFLADDVGPAFYEDTDPQPGEMTAVPILNPESGPNQLPLVILVDRNTASAAEIVAGSLRDYNRALVIGEQTFGKGSVQRIYDFSNEASLRVTVAEWYTPSRGRIQEEGIRPDVLLTTDGTASSAGDPFLNAAVSFMDVGKTRPTDLAPEVAPAEATPAGQ